MEVIDAADVAANRSAAQERSIQRLAAMLAPLVQAGRIYDCGPQKARVLKSSLRARQLLNHKLKAFCYFDRLATFISSVFTLSGAVSTLPSLRSMVTTHLQADGPSEYIIPVLVSTT